MHKLEVIILGPSLFFFSLNELKDHLKFNIISGDKNIIKNGFVNGKILLCHKEFLKNQDNVDFINKCKCTTILASNNNNYKVNHAFSGLLKLPTTLNELNLTIDNCVAKKIFNKNSSIKIKDYLLDKNEKKLNKCNISLVLTEKEIQLIELFLENSNPISKNKILSLVWHYSTDADTHTVETHIYRLRKKINEKFSDNNFISNNKEGYYL